MSEQEDQQLQEYQQQKREKKVERQEQQLDLDYKRMNYCDTCGKHTFWEKEYCSVCKVK
jgi:uncharacterized OB-fold protein